ncbi:MULTISPECIES: Xaa-Pro peptidase family protein [unclassified Leclercia]|uniref:M24 family metallopeptidase n=2 Tax=Leclercia barmai TaxID=2785629 RepID=A0ABS7S1M5_9ENTR|nr:MULTISPECIES: aminopeptidase P family protein [unclassified Leclercia]MBZ0059451.1 M24 family metallopeptidase [Leclercia sp. EMC7]MCM5697415.1 M24 family metallopeptidase [Leclercia sp. LTM01]MCM5701990.1 M24 family metallopeptidase [Leclercia sp. LTM14]
MYSKDIQLQAAESPRKFMDVAPVLLSDATMLERKNKILAGMREEDFDALIIYADKEHGGNFEYLTGFIPRFEEGLLILEQSGKATVILGNENLKMASHSRIPVTLKHCPHFSLPNQPMDNEKALEELFIEAGLNTKSRIGLVGWKMFTSAFADNKKYFDLPYFIVDAIKNSTPTKVVLKNAAHLFIHGDKGARSTNNENEIAHYEYGANLASNCILDAMNAVEPGVRETDLGALLAAEGQYQTVVTIAATGQRFEKANFYPTYKKVERGNPVSMTTGFRGGLSSRTAFAVADADELPENQKDYLERMAKPYFGAVAAWLENIKIGMPGGELYDLIEQVLPKDTYGWHLNPGHLSAEEEWMSSPVYHRSAEPLKSGMIMQIDIIPSVAGYTGVSAEESVALADAALQQKIAGTYPELWQRITARREYIRTVLNIRLSDDVIPLSNTVAYMRPFLLDKAKALVCQ